MKLRDYKAWIKRYGWVLEKGGFDWKVMDSSGKVIIKNIIVTHPGREVTAFCVQKTDKIIKALS
ncbi:MAG: hypothetical protein C4530_24165 [Desulfobacteraceae bacterium]|nr:MAG: hypothetical protein C4530_24165 [Desulfobacteraceae bacterium]